jgi:chloramphenicol 3-O phosphotransferase
MANGNIIFLNGTSSSGKTSIAKVLQEMLDEPYLHFSGDNFLRMLPERYFSPEVVPKVISAMHHCISASALVGNNVIVDHVLEDKQWLEECIRLLAGFSVLFVGVRCPLEELEHRERKRNREQGLARYQFGLVHAHGVYDLEVDTSVYSPMDCASQIKEALRDIHSSNAFINLKDLLPENREIIPPKNSMHTPL